MILLECIITSIRKFFSAKLTANIFSPKTFLGIRFQVTTLIHLYLSTAQCRLSISYEPPGDTQELLLYKISTPGNVCAVQWRVCSTVEDIQYSGGIPSVRGRDIISAVEGYNQYSGGISSVQWRDIISTAEGYHQYCGGISSVQWRDIISTVEGYHQYSGGISSVQWRDIISTVDGYHQYSGGI